MGRIPRVILPGLLAAAGITGVATILAGEGLDRAEKWVSIAGVTVSIVLSAVGLAVAWLAWRRPAAPVPAAPAPAPGAGAGPAPAVPGPRVDVRGSRGVQVGDHNTQHNTF